MPLLVNVNSLLLQTASHTAASPCIQHRYWVPRSNVNTARVGERGDYGDMQRRKGKPGHLIGSKFMGEDSSRKKEQKSEFLKTQAPPVKSTETAIYSER